MKTHNPFPDIPIYQSSIPLTGDILRLMSCKQAWECIRIRMQKMRMLNSVKWEVISSSPSIFFKKMIMTQGYLIINDKEHDISWLLDYDQVMMICDTITGRVFSYIFMDSLSPNCKSRFSSNLLTKIYSTWDGAFDNLGNDTYKVIKNWEPLVQGLMLREHDPLSLSSEFLSELLDNDNVVKELLSCQENLLASESLSVHHLGELHGLYRHWGHPTVDEEAGCKKVKDIAKSRKLPNPKIMEKASGVFARQFCISFISEHGRWPRIDVSKLPEKCPLRHSITSNITTLNLYSPRYPTIHWSLITFSKEFPFDYHVDYLAKCEDKAISPYLSDLPTIYARETLGYDPGYPMSSRRVLLEVLRKGEVSIEKNCEIIQRREVPDNWKIILVHAKEREIKIDPRLFAMFVLEMRLYFAVTESNIANTIFKYFPQQTMTLSENELTKRLYSMGEDNMTELTVPFFMSIDFKSWNLHWQYLTTHNIQVHLENLFGVPGLYTYAHIFFQQAIVAISSRFNPPEALINNDAFKKKNPYSYYQSNIVHGDKIWTNHRGGFEGILQKLWTLITIVMLLMLEMKTCVKSYIIGQGDNQVLKIMVPIPEFKNNVSTGDGDDTLKDVLIKRNQEYFSNRLKSYLETLSQIASDFRVVIKKEESWFSSRIINYGKDILYNGAYLSQGLKRISRVMPDTNDLCSVHKLLRSANLHNGSFFREIDHLSSSEWLFMINLRFHCKSLY